MKWVLSTLLLSCAMWGAPLGVSDTLPPIELADQFDVNHTIDPAVSKILITFDKESSVTANQFIAQEENSSVFLGSKNMVFIANISHMPAIITKLFAIPKMKKYKHPILLINDKNHDLFAQQPHHMTMYDLKGGKVEKITYIKSAEDLGASLQR